MLLEFGSEKINDGYLREYLARTKGSYIRKMQKLKKNRSMFLYTITSSDSIFELLGLSVNFPVFVTRALGM